MGSASLMHRPRTRGLAVVAAAGLLAAGCDPAPQVELKNATSAPITIRFEFAPAGPGGSMRLRVDPGRSVLFPSGYLFGGGPILTTGACSYAFGPRPASDEGIAEAYGAVTKMTVSEDFRLSIEGWSSISGLGGTKRAGVQPGWPWSPRAKTCR